jgi:pimeloyl-ACP methyl ester carboxylesterase
MADLMRDGVRIHYDCGGSDNDGLPILLSHGYGATSRMWEPNLPALVAERPVITWDMRGHGRSDSPGDPAQYSHDACVADMAALLDACSAPRAVLAGLSLGGYLSLKFWLAHPERVAALMLFDTGPGYRSDEARERWNDRAMVTAGRASSSGLAHAARGMLAQQDASVIECLPSVDVPTLVLVGADDQPFLGAADYCASKIAGSTKAVIPGAGHMSNMDQPAMFNAEVLAFLRRL